MKEKEIPQTKTEWLKLYLASMEYYQCKLLDMLLNKELTKQEYDDMINKSQEAYKQFLANLTSQ